MRLIDADEFIEALEYLYRHAGWDRREVHFSLADTICNLDMMPTVEAEPKWIPVTERLPEELETVLITFTWKGGRYVTTDRYRYIHTFKDPINWINTSQYMGEKVVAWMPMPKPYERKEE